MIIHFSSVLNPILIDQDILTAFFGNFFFYSNYTSTRFIVAYKKNNEYLHDFVVMPIDAIHSVRGGGEMATVVDEL